MNIADLEPGVRRWLPLLAATTVAGTALGWGVTLLLPHRYEAAASVLVASPQISERPDLTYAGALLDRERTGSIAGLVATPAMAVRVAADVHGTVSRSQLSARVRPGTTLIDITASAPDAARAAALADAAARVLGAMTAELTVRTAAPGPAGTPLVRPIPVQAAPVPVQRQGPRLGLSLGAGAAVGLLLGLAVGLLRRMLGDRVPQASPDGEQAGAPVLAAIPRRPAPLRGMPALPYPAVDEYAEAVRRLRTNLRFLSVDRPPRVLAVTSPRPGDGKTSIAVALAFSLAETGAEVALVDADLRRPAVADCLGLVQELGLTTVLAGQALLCDVVQEAERGATIKVVTGGALPPNPAELLGTGLFRQALKELAGTVDYVIVDTPPLGPVVDGLVLAPTIDGAIVVARPGVTRRTELDQAVRGLRSVGATVLGTVMNMARMPKDDYLPTWTRSGTTRPMLSIVVPRPRRRYSEADPQAVG